MMLAHPLLQSPIKFRENSVPVLIVENGQLFRRLIGDLLAQENGEPGEFALSENASLIEIGKNVQEDNAEPSFSGTGRTAYSDEDPADGGDGSGRSAGENGRVPGGDK